MRQTLAEPAIEATRRADQRSSPRPGRRPGSTGSRTSSRGASRANCGGATAFRRGMTTTARSSSPRPRRKRGRRPAASRCARTRTCSTPGSPPPCGPSPRSAGPTQTEDLKRHYPNDVLISGFDILFFWDARMAMQGIEFMGELPWKTLYLHGLVRDAHGPEDVQVQGQHRRSARPDRQVWRRRAALHAGGDGKPGPRHQIG